MKHYVDKEIKETKRILTKVTCDVCNREIEPSSPFYDVTTHHYEWDNDSIESFKHYQICSDECLKVKFKEYLCLDIDSKYVEISKEVCCVPKSVGVSNKDSNKLVYTATEDESSGEQGSFICKG